MRQKEELIQAMLAGLRDAQLPPARINPFLERSGSPAVAQAEKASRIVARPGIDIGDLLDSGILDDIPAVAKVRSLGSGHLRNDILRQVDIDIKYEGYFRRQEEEVRKFETYEGMRIPESFDFTAIRSLSSEGREKMKKIRPASIGQASRISGVTASDVSVLMVHLRK
jgi:tRNA uridine 5-carboxymethylaminomethyl modification enzyme